MFARYAPLSMKQSPAQSAKNSPFGSARNSPQVSAKSSPQTTPPGSPVKNAPTAQGESTSVVCPSPQVSVKNSSQLSVKTADSPFVSAKNSPALSLKNSPLHKAKVSPNVSATNSPQVKPKSLPNEGKKPYPVQSWDPPAPLSPDPFSPMSPLDESFGANDERQLQLGFQNPQQVIKIFGGSKLAFINLAFNSLDDSIKLDEFQEKVSHTELSLQDAYNQWSRYGLQLDANRKEMQDVIEKQKRSMIAKIEKHADEMNRRLDELMLSHEALAQNMTKGLQMSYLKLEELSQEGYELAQRAIAEKTSFREKKQDVFDEICELHNSVNSNPPLWLPLELKAAEPSDYLISHLFGDISIVDREKYPLNFCEKPHQVSSFSCKTKLDSMPCAVSDMAINSDGDILVCDRNNKFLKMFDKDGRFKMIVGQGNLKDPNRVTVLNQTNTILVCDNVLRCVKLFHKDGTFVCDFIKDLQYPCAITENYKGDIIVCDYLSKMVMVYDQSGTKVLHSFKSQLVAPSHVTTGPTGTILLTDWRSHAAKAFHVNGELMWKFYDKGGGKFQMDQPNGAALDSFHNTLICDSRNHRIHLMNQEGKVERSLLTKADGLKLPMALKTDPAGFLIVAEYQGNIKTFRYMEASVDLLPAGKFISTAPINEAAPELVTISCTETQITDSPAKVATNDTRTYAEDANMSNNNDSNNGNAKPQNGSVGNNVLSKPNIGSDGTELSSSETTQERLNTVNCTTKSESVL